MSVSIGNAGPTSSNRSAWAVIASIAALSLAGAHVVRQRAGTVAILEVPLATPPGITLQLTPGHKRARDATTGEGVYADAQGLTLYTHDAQTSCAAGCGDEWLPATAAGTATTTGEWSTVIGSAGGAGARQWTYRGSPVYRYAGDREIGQTGGDGSHWHAIRFRPSDGVLLPADVVIREIPDAGGIAFTDPSDRTLYILDGTASQASAACAGDCARQWLPVLAPGVAVPVGDFSPTARDDGITQWAYRGHALYRYAGDVVPHDVQGRDVDPRFHVALLRRYFQPSDLIVWRSAALGNLLGTRAGLALYERDRALPEEGHDFHIDHGPPALGRAFGTATCDAACSQTWHPYAAPADARPSGFWEIVVRPEGTRQWAYKGYPLYTYGPDHPGELGGQDRYDLAPPADESGFLGDPTVVPAPVAAPPDAKPIDPADHKGMGLASMFWHAVAP